MSFATSLALRVSLLLCVASIVGADESTVEEVLADVPDYSAVGYAAGAEPLPEVEVVETLEPVAGDNHTRIQAAIDRVGQLPHNDSGFRGAVLLKAGRYEVSETLMLSRSGVVLRGEGSGDDGTVLVPTKREPHVVIFVRGPGSARFEEQADTRQDVLVPADASLPAKQKQISVADASGFSVGDRVLLVRPSTPEWLPSIGMDKLSEGAADPDGVVRGKNWTIEQSTMRYIRIIDAIDGNTITLDAPLIVAVDDKRPAYVTHYDLTNEIDRVGVESLRIKSEFDPSVIATDKTSGTTYYADEQHARTGVQLDRVTNAWVRDVTALHLSGSTVAVAPSASFVTIIDCKSLQPVSRITGRRRYAFTMNGQRVLVARCESEYGRHDFTFTRWAPGPNVYFDCVARGGFSFVEPHGQWNTGGLYDNVTVDGPPRASLAAGNRGTSGSGHGWTAATFTFWNSDAPAILLMSPPGSINRFVGRPGFVDPKPERATWLANWFGYRSSLNGITPLPDHPSVAGDDASLFVSLDGAVEPRSLFLHQLEARLGSEAVERVTSDFVSPTTQPTMPYDPPVDVKPTTTPVLYQQTFNNVNALDDFTIELEDAGDVAIRDGKLVVDVPAGATIWLSEKFTGPLLIEYDVTAVDAGGPTDRVSDLNCFWMATDSRGEFFDVERTGQFNSYHPLRCYYVGFGGHDNTKTRFRRYIGDAELRPLLAEHDLSSPVIEPNRTYRVSLLADGSRVEYRLDGKPIFTINDQNPYTTGRFGLRTVRNHLTLDNLTITRPHAD
jgi:hypothetical protein